MKHLNIKCENLKLLWEYIGKTLENINRGNYFQYRTPVTQDIRARTDKWDCIKLKSFCISKETVTKIKRQLNGRKSLLTILQIKD
jgi:hypothetical protein